MWGDSKNAYHIKKSVNQIYKYTKRDVEFVQIIMWSGWHKALWQPLLFCCAPASCSLPQPVPHSHQRQFHAAAQGSSELRQRQFRAATKAVPSNVPLPLAGVPANISTVLGSDYSSTWLGLLQYLIQITPVLGTDYSSTLAGFPGRQGKNRRGT